MKTTVSIPDELCLIADRLAKRLGTSRSDLFSRALREFVARHSTEEVTAALDKVWGKVGDGEAAFVREAGRRRLNEVP